jgi:hypothetical protein
METKGKMWIEGYYNSDLALVGFDVNCEKGKV